jgi:hypothetical protein
MAETMAVPRVPAQQPAEAAAPPAAPAAPPAATSRPAQVRELWYRNLQVILFTTGAVLMPGGIFAIFLGWYGVAHTKYQYDQLPYVVSGGLIGLALVFIGGFLYFGAWLSRMANEQRESTRRLADSMLALADIVARQGGAAAPTSAAAVDDELVLAGSGSTLHRRDCPLIAHREDLRPAGGERNGYHTCRVCRPSID